MVPSKFTLMLTHYNSALSPSKHPIYLILNYYNKRLIAVFSLTPIRTSNFFQIPLKILSKSPLSTLKSPLNQL